MLKSAFFFDEMLTPKLITFIYWLMLLGVLISGLTMMFSAYGSFLGGLGMIVFGGVGARIGCELMMVVFKINESLKKMAGSGN